MEDLPKIVGIAVAAVGIFSAVVRWGISQYFGKARELELLKEESTKKAIATLAESFEGLRMDLNKISDQLVQLRTCMDELKTSHRDIKRQVRPIKDAKLVRLADDLFVFKKTTE
jgi:hypothetical protein